MDILSEHDMKAKGEDRVWKTIFSKSGTPKSASQTQLGQQLLMKDAIKLVPIMRQWIDFDTSKLDRKKIQQTFENDDVLLQKIVEVFLILSSTTHVVKVNPEKVQIRHKNINIINEKILQELTFNQVWRFVEVVIEASEYFHVDYTTVRKNNSFLKSVRYSCNLSETILDALSAKAHEAFFSEPITIVPKPWKYENGKLSGGYHHYEFQMIRAKFFDVDYSQYSQDVFESINYIQSIPWKVNGRIVEEIKNNLKFPKKEDFVKTEYPNSDDCEWDIDLKELKENDPLLKKLQDFRKIYYDQTELYNGDKRDFESAIGKFRAMKLAVGIAERYQDAQEIYFPHSFDFRGRVYPIPIGLSPQGADGVKAMLEYARGEVLNEQGILWAWAYLASLYGDDKICFEDRVTRGKQLIDADYKDADEPYQFLAHQLEMNKFLLDDQYEFRGRVHLDACNSGSQFTSSMTGDLSGCIATNVIPTITKDGQDRQDAYMLVANKSLNQTVEELLLCDEEDLKERLELFKELLEEKGRKICKTPVMVSNYGGTAGGRSEIIWNMLRELGVDRKWITKKNAALYSRIIGDSIAGVLNGGKAFEQYIHSMNNLIAKQNKAVIWDTSDGFQVIHQKKKEMKPISVSCFLPGVRRATTIIQKRFSKNMNPAKMKSAIAPNYVHSLDAELLRRVALRMKKQGIRDSDFIHDSFGCHPNYVGEMLIILKEVFRDMMKDDPLNELDAQLRLQLSDDKVTEKAANAITVPKLGDLDLDLVMKSDWFFS